MTMNRLDSPGALASLRQRIIEQRKHDKPCISICGGTGCLALGAGKLGELFIAELAAQGLSDSIDIRHTGCHGFCEKGTVVVIHPSDVCYLQVQPTDVPEVVAAVKSGNIVERLLFTDPATGEKIAKQSDIPFYRYQYRLVLGDNQRIDPKNIEDYLAVGGYKALSKVVSGMTPDQVLSEVEQAQLRGRGGAGFPAGKKWFTTKNAPGEPKYVIVNCDEGDPGAFMDRSVMEGNPHCVLEGLMIGAYAIGSHEGYVYVRAEYPLAVTNLFRAIAQAEEYGLLGKNILGSGFDFTVKVHQGAGAFVSGESSALMTAIEGRVGEPRPKYIRTAVRGLWNKPSNLNNVETWANVPQIINRGAEWFKSIGTSGSSGTKIFALVGKVNNTGLVEVPMGTTLKDIVFKIGGGVRDGKKLKAVQTGGPSGGCIPVEYMDTPVDFDELDKLGSMVGSGGMIVLDEETCMVDLAKYFLTFLADESCGKCLPCREGLKQMIDIVTRITRGEAEMEELDTLEELAETLKDACLCALGQTAANPLLTTLRYFRPEYETHIRDKKCPAGICPDLVTFYIDADKCKACSLCIRTCASSAIVGSKQMVHVIEQSKCIKCGACVDICPPKFGAILKVPGRNAPEGTPKEPIKVRHKVK